MLGGKVVNVCHCAEGLVPKLGPHHTQPATPRKLRMTVEDVEALDTARGIVWALVMLEMQLLFLSSPAATVLA